MVVEMMEILAMRGSKQPKGVSPSPGVCRNLFGPVDHESLQLELKQQQNELESNYKEKWNFDFKSETPLQGHFQWEKIDNNADIPGAYYHPHLEKVKRALNFNAVSGDHPKTACNKELKDIAATSPSSCAPLTQVSSPSPASRSVSNHRLKRLQRHSKRSYSVIAPNDENNPLTSTPKRSKRQQNRKMTEFMSVQKQRSRPSSAQKSAE